jgi:invasion protein IalB
MGRPQGSAVQTGGNRGTKMTYRTMSAKARTASKVFAALTATIMLAAVGVSYAVAQPTPAPPNPPPAPARPRPAPAKPAAQPAPQQQAPAAQQQQPPAQQQAAPNGGDQPQLIFSPWVKLCNKDADPKAKRICVTVKDGRVESGLLVVSVAIIEMDGEAKKLLRMSLPYGVALQHGTRLIVDQGQPATSPFVTCLPPVVPPGGCIADYEASADMIGRMKKGQILTVQAIHMNGQAMSPQMDLKDFAKAYDGPPTDPKVFEEQQKKLQDELQKRAEEARKRLENQPPQAAAPAPGTPPAR